MRRSLRLSLLLALLAPAVSLAQQGSAELRGRVLDAQEGALPGAAVIARNQETGMFRQVTSNADGTYFLSGVVPGTYEITVELTGFKRTTRRDVRIEIGKTATLDVKMDLGGKEEEVTVTGQAPVVDVTSKEVGGNITARELTDLPSINRNFIGLIGVLPGITPNVSTESFGSDSITANGQDARNNNYLLDGANNNDDVIGQRAGTQARTPLEAIQEFQVLINQYDAEFGRTTGAVINAITKQGTNALRGSAFAFAQDASLTEKDYFTKKNNLDKPDTKFQQFGFTVGGPVVKDKAHLFASLERVIIDDARQINLTARPDLNAAPVTQTRVWNTLVRFDHQLNASHSWNVRWLREHSPQFNQIVPSAAGPPGSTQLPVSLAASREEDDLDQTVAAAFNSALGNTRFNSLRVTFTQEDVAFANPGFNGNGQDQAALPPTLRFRTYIDGQSEVAQARVNNAYQLEDTFSWFIPGGRGDHNLRFGVQYQYSTQKSDTQDFMNGVFSFAGDRPFNANDPTTYPERLTVRVPGASIVDLKTHYFGFFAQDKWRLSNRLTLSLGVRYDVERIPLDEADNPAFAAGADAPTDSNNVAPRLGFAWDPRGDGHTVVRGGVGRFYDRTHFELITAIQTAGVFSNSFLVNFPTNAADPGPSQGRLPTDPFLVNGPVLNSALLAAGFPSGARIRNTGTVVLDSPDRVVPYTDQFTLGAERQLFRDFSVSVDYIHSRGHDQFMSREINPGLRVDTTRTGRVNRTNPLFTASALQRVNEGEIRYDALQVQAEKRWSDNYRFRVSYTLSHSRGNTSGAGIPNSNLQLLDDMRLDANEGPTDVDRRHNFVFSGAATVPGTGLSIGAVVRALSGLAFTIQDQSTDPDRNGVLFDPLPAGTYSGSGDDAITVDNAGGRNGAWGPAFFQADLRLAYQLRFGGRTAELVGEVYNLTNRANFANPTGDRRSPNFLVLTALRAGAIPRTAQLGLKLTF
jgi:outer membrane receptor protein involved in Fe transport